MMMAGTVLTAGTQLAEGDMAEDAANAEARQLRRNSKATYAEGTRTAQEYYRQGQINTSNMRAQMAGSGGVTTDAAAVESLGESDRIGSYNAMSAMFSHQVKSDAQAYQAKVRRVEGKNAKRASRIKALGTIISGATMAASAGGLGGATTKMSPVEKMYAGGRTTF